MKSRHQGHEGVIVDLTRELLAILQFEGCPSPGNGELAAPAFHPGKVSLGAKEAVLLMRVVVTKGANLGNGAGSINDIIFQNATLSDEHITSNT